MNFAFRSVSRALLSKSVLSKPATSCFVVSSRTASSNGSTGWKKMSSDSKYGINEKVLKNRQTQYQIHPLLVNRTSFKTMTGEPMTDEEFGSILEAGRWAPSHFNVQPWRLIYVKTGSEQWDQFVNYLWPVNQEWAKKSSVLMIAATNKYINVYGIYKQLIPHDIFGVGAAVENMLLEATGRGLVAHPMAGFYRDKIFEDFKLSEKEFRIEVMVAFGKPDPKADDGIGPRNPIEDFAGEEKYPDRDDKFELNLEGIEKIMGWE